MMKKKISFSFLTTANRRHQEDRFLSIRRRFLRVWDEECRLMVKEIILCFLVLVFDDDRSDTRVIRLNAMTVNTSSMNEASFDMILL